MFPPRVPSGREVVEKCSHPECPRNRRWWKNVPTPSALGIGGGGKMFPLRVPSGQEVVEKCSHSECPRDGRWWKYSPFRVLRWSYDCHVTGWKKGVREV